MRTGLYVLSLVLAALSVHAAPIAEAGPSLAGPALFSHDPYSIHRRSSPPLSKRGDEDLTAELEAEDDLTEEMNLASCSTECGVIKIQGVKSEKEALCSEPGLEATKGCAQCIDTTWPNTRFQASAMSEYEKLVALCQGDEQ